jgi:hypothetical protein
MTLDKDANESTTVQTSAIFHSEIRAAGDAALFEAEGKAVC